MTNWMVVTPEYGEKIPILDDGTGPIEYVSDVLEVEAPNARQARVLAVREWRRLSRTGKWRDARWIRDQDTDGASPFTGLKVFNMDLDDDEFNHRYHPQQR